MKIVGYTLAAAVLALGAADAQAPAAGQKPAA